MTDLPEAMVLQAADEILQAAGSGMRFYSMPSTRERILRVTETAMQNALTAAGVAEMREALEATIFGLEAAEACLKTWNEGRGSPVNVDGIVKRARAALQGSSHE